LAEICLIWDIAVECKRNKYFYRESMAHASSKTKPEPRQVLTGAVLRASALLEITQSGLSHILGLSPSTVSRMANGTYVLDTQKKEWELGALFVRLFRSLDALIGSNDSAARRWLNGENRGLAGRPADLIRTTEGLVRVVQYLDCARGRI
jgi:hypothetical protein